MSFTRLNSDTCTYEHNLKQSTGPSEYLLMTPHDRCNECFQTDPSIRMSHQVRAPSGVSRCADHHIIDVDSELKNIVRPATNCPTGKYLGEKFCNLKHFRDCDRRAPTEGTRLSNPPCTLRGTGWNRWEWLCRNPQDKALVPFDYNINYRLIAKDNHRPCIPKPIDQTPSLPEKNEEEVYYQPQPRPISDFPTGLTWRNCGTYAGYNT